MGGADVIVRGATGTLVFGMLPVVLMTIVSGVLMFLVSAMTGGAVPSDRTLARYFPRSTHAAVPSA